MNIVCVYCAMPTNCGVEKKIPVLIDFQLINWKFVNDSLSALNQFVCVCAICTCVRIRVDQIISSYDDLISGEKSAFIYLNE